MMPTVPKIFIFITTRFGDRDMVGCAMAEDGVPLAEHLSSNRIWLAHDMGLSSDWKHDAYKAHYPDGYELEWVEDPKKHEGVQAAYAKNQLLEDTANADIEETNKEEMEDDTDAARIAHFGSDG